MRRVRRMRCSVTVLERCRGGQGKASEKEDEVEEEEEAPRRGLESLWQSTDVSLNR